MALTYGQFGAKSPDLYLAYLYSRVVEHGCGEAFMLAWGRGADNGFPRVSGGGVGGIERGDIVRVVDGLGALGFSCCCRDSSFCLSRDRCNSVFGGEVVGNNDGASEGEFKSYRCESEHGVGKNGGLSGDVCVGVSDGVDANEESVGVNTLRNREWRRLKKERKVRKQLMQSVSSVPEWRRGAGANGLNDVGGGHKVEEKGVRFGYFSGLSDDKRSALRESRAARLEAENKLQQAKAERALELLKASDIEKEKKMNETRVMRNTELNKVQVEQAFSRLSATGNVPGFAETVVSGAPTLSSGSISPNSSVSAAEVHAMQKELLELQLQSKEYNRLKESVRKYIPESVYDNLVREAAKTADTSFTADTMGHELANGGGYHYCDDGRYRPGENFDGW